MSAPEETWEDVAAHMRQMAITAREFRLPPEDCDDLTQYAAALDTIRAERDALAARVERLEAALAWAAEAPMSETQKLLGQTEEEAAQEYIEWSNAKPAHYNDTLAAAVESVARAAISTDAQ
jgi:3-phenylpropionate/cinnamic acid dioxygenase small subunit